MPDVNRIVDAIYSDIYYTFWACASLIFCFRIIVKGE